MLTRDYSGTMNGMQTAVARVRYAFLLISCIAASPPYLYAVASKYVLKINIIKHLFRRKQVKRPHVNGETISSITKFKVEVVEAIISDFPVRAQQLQNWADIKR